MVETSHGGDDKSAPVSDTITEIELTEQHAAKALESARARAAENVRGQPLTSSTPE
jgi:hypothetical protein